MNKLIRQTILACTVLFHLPFAAAESPIKVGVIAEMTGQQAEYGLQMTNGMKLYLHEHGEKVVGRKVELVVRDVGGANPEVAKRLAQELITREKVHFLAGFGFTPNAMAVAPVATQAQVPMIVMNAAGRAIPSRSPFIVRVSMTIAENAQAVAAWAAKNHVRTVYLLYADYMPGIEGAGQFRSTFVAAGGQVVGEAAVPLRGGEISPYIQRIKDMRPDAVFVWFPSGELATSAVKAYRERGLDVAGIKLLGTGDAVDDMFLNSIGDQAIGFVTAGHYSYAHQSAKNHNFIRGYQKLYGTTIRPNFMAVAGYDGMSAIHTAIRMTGADLNGEKIVNAMKGMKIDSPRGPIMIDAGTRDIVQTIYIRRVEKRGGELFNIEFERHHDLTQ